MPRGFPCWFPPLAIYLAASVVANLLVALYIGHERAIYYWDYANYWNQFDHYTRLLQASPRDALRQLIGSVKYSEYNGIAAFLLTPFGLLFGTGRLSYVLAVTNLYALPAAAAAAWALSRIHPRGAAPCSVTPFPLSACSYSTFFLVLTCAALWHPVLRGFPDVISLIPGFFITGIWLRKPAGQWGIREMLLVGLLMAMMVLFRRIFAYWVVGFGTAALLVDALVPLARRDTRAGGAAAFLRLAAAGALMVGALLLFARPMTLTMLTTDYTSLYAMYQSGRGPLAQVASAVRYFGLPLALAAAGGVAIAWRTRVLHRALLFWVVQISTGYLTLLQVTDFHRHHYYILLPGLLALCALLAHRTPRRAAWVLPSLFVVGTALAFIPAFAPAPAAVFRLLAPSLAYPFHRGDLPEIHRLLRRLDSLPGATDPARGVYVLASSDILNDELLRAARRVLPPDPAPRAVIRPTANKDSPVFGFPRDLLRAAVVVVADPVQVHLAGTNAQAVIRAPWQALHEPAGFGGAYAASGDAYALDQEVRVTLWLRRPEPFSTAQVASLRDTFLLLHPEGASEPYDFTPPAGSAP